MDINQSESGKRWVLICAICSKYTATFLLKSSLMEQSIKVPTEIIQLCKLARKIQSREELIKIIACYYFNINSLFCHSYRCMPAGPWNEVMGWTGRACCWAESPREEAAYHRLSTHPCLRGRSARDLDSEWSIGKYDANLHLPCISLPLAAGSPLSVFCGEGTASGSSLGHLCWWAEPGAATVGPGTLCSPAEAPHDLSTGQREVYCGKQRAKVVTEATCCYHKGYNKAMSCWKLLLSNTNLDWI